eukprot:268272-Rhodomonas_salina.5
MRKRLSPGSTATVRWGVDGECEQRQEDEAVTRVPWHATRDSFPPSLPFLLLPLLLCILLRCRGKVCVVRGREKIFGS